MKLNQITNQIAVNFEIIEKDKDYIDYIKEKQYRELIWELFLKEINPNSYFIIKPLSHEVSELYFGKEFKQRIIYSDGFENLTNLFNEVGDYLEENETKKGDPVYLVYAYWLHGGTDMENADSDEKLLKVFKNLEEARKFGKKYRENHNVTNINIRSEEVR